MRANTKQRVLLVVTKSNFGGAQRYVFEIASALQARGDIVAVASGGTEGQLIDRLHAAGISHLPITSFQRDISLGKELRSAYELLNHIRAFKPTTLHLNSSKAGGIGALIGRLLLVPQIIFTAHGWQYHEQRPWLWRRVTFFLSWVTGLLAHRVITVSRYDKDTAPKWLVRNKCLVIRTGVPDSIVVPKIQAEQRLGIVPKQNTIQIGTVAELTTNKNLQFAIDAVHRHNLSNTGTHIVYTIIGAGELKKPLLSYIKENDIDHVTLAGAVSDARKYLKAFDVFLLPSLKEGMPYALLEAAAAELPLIASDVGGVSELIRTTDNGLLISPTDPDSLDRALKTITNATQRRRLGAAAYERSKFFTLTKMLERTIQVYDSNTTSSVNTESRAID